MELQVNSPNKVIVKQLESIIKNLEDAKHCIWDDTDARTGINKAQAIASTLKDLLSE